ICASLQHSLVRMLLQKLKRASRETGINEIAIAGGVSANSGLRASLKKLAEEKQWKVYVPDFQYCTDNAGMVAMAAHYHFLQQKFVGLDVSPMARMKFGTSEL
ncbi:tRNA (adenosine(37)-N6)-threonylcarbamoyltransferase complex transferase subunit TsaD, partial [Fulvivirga sp. RKSG066]|nr:tRNA (adenosine(37)-N6)-threonylcarbamoyltransferase complex transferase subunit TsaD [Fulvivirga aurantia]